MLKRSLGFWGVFSIAAGAMISSGLFILPGIAFAKAGPAVILSYLLASVLVIPSMLSKAELATAMPKAGGTYFFIERSLGAMWGLFSGLANWFSVALKSAFAVVGMAILIKIVINMLTPYDLGPWHLKLISAACCAFFTVLNIVSVKHAGRLQIFLVAAMFIILGAFVAFGAGSVDTARFQGFFAKGFSPLLATSGLVFISFGGLTKVASIAEEVKHPGRNLPRGMFLAWFVVTCFYLAVVTVTVGLVDPESLAASKMPVSLAASKFMATPGFVIIAIAAIAAFVTTANGGILAASRYPLAMGRDKLLPAPMSRLSKRFNTPYISILLTGGFMIASVVFLELVILVKTASTLMIILFILENASVIIMRESKIQSYRPKYKSPLYPYIQIAAIVSYGILIIDMGKIPLLISAGFVVLSAAWYFIYVSRNTSRASAAMHIVERVTDLQLQTVTLEDELRDILLQRDDIIEDRFDKLIKNCRILDITEKIPAEKAIRQAVSILADRLAIDEFVLFEKFLHRESQGSTVIQPGLAIPHIVVDGENKFDILMVRANPGIEFPHSPDPVNTMFILVGSKDQRNYHLRALMAIAQIVQEKDFETRWQTARDKETLRNLILLSTRKRDTKK